MSLSPGLGGRLRARLLRTERTRLLEEIGLLQEALLPHVPERLADLGISVAYRPADGPGAGGDFYDAFPLRDRRVGLLVGDVSGHGRDALAHTAQLRFALRAYMEAGLAPRLALQVAGGSTGHDLGGSFATVVAARYEPASHALSYACAGHPPPVMARAAADRGGERVRAITAVASPPLGLGELTGLRQTTIGLEPGELACFYTDGVVEARTADGLYGRDRLERALQALAPVSAPARAAALRPPAPVATELIERVTEATERTPDDMAVCVLERRAGQPHRIWFRIEELEVRPPDMADDTIATFMAACGRVTGEQLLETIETVGELARAGRPALLRVRAAPQTVRVQVLPLAAEAMPEIIDGRRGQARW